MRLLYDGLYIFHIDLTILCDIRNTIVKGDAEFLKALNGFLAKIKKDGTHDKLHLKWFKNTDWLKDVQ